MAQSLRFAIFMLVMCLPLRAQVITFEPPLYTGSPAGVPLAGQEGWATVPQGAVPMRVFTYAGHGLGFAANPVGQTQGAAGQAAASNSSAQLDIDFSAGDLSRLTFDIAVKYNGVLPAVGNPGSFSLQPTGSSQSFRTLNRWTNPATADSWIAGYNIFDAAGTLRPSTVAGSAWTDLNPNHWYRQSTLIDFTSNRVLEVSITDLHTGESATVLPEGWFLEGGATPVVPRPTAIRAFINGADNAVAWDNIRIEAVTITAGLVHRALGQAVVSPLAGGGLRIANVGPSGFDGAEVRLPSTSGWENSFDLSPDVLWGTHIRWNPRGTRGGQVQVSPGDLTLRREQAFYTAEPDFGPAGSPFYSVTIRNQGEETFRQDNLKGAVVEFVPIQPGPTEVLCSATWERLSWLWRFRGLDPRVPPIQFRVGGVPIVGDEIEFTPSNPVPGFERMEFADIFIALPNGGEFTFHRQWVRSRGIRVAGGDETVLALDQNSLALSHREPLGPARAEVLATGAEGVGHTVMLHPALPLEATIEGQAFRVDRRIESLLSSVLIVRNPLGLSLAGEFNPIGSPTYTVQAFLDGLLVAQQGGLAGFAVQTNLAGPVAATMRCDEGAVWDVLFSASLLVSIAGNPPVPADVLRFLPDSPVPPIPGDDHLGRWTFLGFPDAEMTNVTARHFGFEHAGVGPAILEGRARPLDATGVITLRNIGSSGEVGVEILIPPDSTLWEMEIDPPIRPAPTATITARSFGQFENGPVDLVSSASVSATAGPELFVDADFGAVAAQVIESNYSCAGVPSLVEGEPGQRVRWRIRRWPRWVKISIGETYYDLHYGFDQCTEVTPQGGNTQSSDYVDVFTRGPVEDVRHYTSIKVLAGDIEQLDIVQQASSNFPACYADCDHTTGVGVLDIFDFICFGARFAENHSYSCNCDISTGVNVCDVLDFLCFGNAFAAGCN